MKRLIAIFLIVGLFIGCSSKKLSREEASKIIKQEMEYPKIVDYDIFCSDPVFVKKVIDAGLERNGFVTVHRTQKLKDIGKPLIEFTDKAKPYLLPTPEKDKAIQVQKVKLADEDLIEVTGVKATEDGKQAVAEYTTTFRNVSGFSALTDINFNKTTTRKANFAVYDDGWRLEKIR